MTTSWLVNDHDTVDAKRPGMSLRCRLVMILVFFGPAIFFACNGDYVLATVCAVAGVAAFSGYRIGVAAIVGSIAAIVAAIAYAPSLGYEQELRFTQWFGTTGLLNRFLAVGVIGLGITFAVTGLAALVARRVCRKYAGFDSLNRWCGLGLGAVEGLIACLFFLGGMLVIVPTEKELTEMRSADNTCGQFLSKAILATTEHTHASRLGPIIEEYNPFVRCPQLNKVEEVQKSVRVLSDPKKIEELLNHPNIRKLQQRPEIKTLVSKLMDDPGIRDVLRSGKQMNRSMAMTLLNHPAVLELVDQPGFVEAATKAIRSTNPIVP
jgi:hypothetical protein